ncbi:MAG: hypothetical protein ABJN65_00050 [Parasphingorhabdus sp.]
MQRLKGNLSIILIWLAVCAVMVFVTRDQIASGIGWGPDDQLRQVQIRDWLAGQSWFDTTQYRIADPDSQPMHWTRWIEIPLVMIIILLTPLLGAAVAESAAMTIVPLVGLLCVMWLVWKITAELFDRQIAVLAAALTATAVPVVAQLRPMRIDHHGWQIVLALVALWTMFWPNRRSAGVVLGAGLALWLSISMEGLPLTIGFIALLAWRWSVLLEQGSRLLWALISFLLTSIALFWGSQGGLDALINYCDAISPAHLLATGAGAVIILPTIYFSPRSIWIRIVALIMAGALALFTMWFSAPQCIGSAFANIDPLVRDTWLVNVNEGLPIWDQPLEEVMNLFGGSIIVGLGSLLFIWSHRQNSFDRPKFFLIVYAFLWALIVSIFVQRASSVAAAYALPLVAWAVHHGFKAAREITNPSARILATVSVVLLILPGPLALGIINAFDGSVEQEQEKLAVVGDTPSCDSSASIERLNALPQAIMVAPLDFGPEILVTTPHSVVATSHHRNDKAMADQIYIFTKPLNEARKLLQNRNAHYIILCENEAELEVYARLQPEGLSASLQKEAIPKWLQSVHLRDSGLKIWRIVPKTFENEM